MQHIERYHNAALTKGRRLLLEYDRKMTEKGDFSLTGEANEKIAALAKELTTDTLNKVLAEASARMKNGFSLSDN